MKKDLYESFLHSTKANIELINQRVINNTKDYLALNQLAS